MSHIQIPVMTHYFDVNDLVSAMPCTLTQCKVASGRWIGDTLPAVCRTIYSRIPHKSQSKKCASPTWPTGNGVRYSDETAHLQRRQGNEEGRTRTQEDTRAHDGPRKKASALGPPLD